MWCAMAQYIVSVETWSYSRLVEIEHIANLIHNVLNDEEINHIGFISYDTFRNGMLNEWES